MISVFDLIVGIPKFLLSKKRYTAYMGRLARIEHRGTVRAAIQWYVDRYEIDLRESARPDPGDYASFNDFFTRALRSGARPLANADLVSPADGRVSQLGSIRSGEIFQAKGHHFTARDLLGGDAALAQRFADGNFVNIYLSPKDYHRIHIPCRGRLRRMIYLPGTLHSVSPDHARRIPTLFARNERVVCVFDGPLGVFAMVLVGATVVGTVATTWHGQVTPPRRDGAVHTWHYDDQVIELDQGAEMGRFLLGSTVILLTERGAIGLDERWQPEMPIRMGEALGRAPALVSTCTMGE